MSNYLARVAAAGARTGSVARPPVTVPRLPPDTGAFLPAPRGEGEHDDAPPVPESARAGDSDPAVPAPDVPVAAQAPVSRPERLGGARSEPVLGVSGAEVGPEPVHVASASVRPDPEESPAQ